MVKRNVFFSGSFQSQQQSIPANKQVVTCRNNPIYIFNCGHKIDGKRKSNIFRQDLFKTGRQDCFYSKWNLRNILVEVLQENWKLSVKKYVQMEFVDPKSNSSLFPRWSHDFFRENSSNTPLFQKIYNMFFSFFPPSLV